ncbi:MAG: hypothetical protein L6R19_14450 [Alphaproteobacteria bacterium]|nr:hypothetical protein [Alphaproteobacteria bacterium]
MARFLFATALLFALGALGWGLTTGLPLESEEEAVADELRRTATPERIAEEATRALDRGDVDDAVAYAELGDFLGWPPDDALRARLAAAVEAEGRVATHLSRCAAGALGGDMNTTASIVCMVAADFTTLGDLRDIVIQGGALAAGEEYDAIVLGLSVVGLAATGIAVMTAGGGGPAKAGLSVMKAAKRADLLSPGLMRNASALVGDAIAPVRRVLAQADYRRPSAVAEALGGEIKQVARSDGAVKLMRAAEEVDAVRREHGVAEAAKMLRHAESVEDVGQIARLYAKLGRKARPVMAITGKTSIHAFKVGYKLTREMLAPLALLLAAAGALAGGAGVRRAILRRGFARQPLLRRGWRDRTWPRASGRSLPDEGRNA